MPLTKTFFRYLLLLLSVLPITLSAQINETILKVAIPDAYILTDDIISNFESNHPGVIVEIITPARVPSIMPVEEDIESTLASFADYSALADVLFMDTARLSTSVIDSGLILDIEPLIQTDPNFSTEFSEILTPFSYNGRHFLLPFLLDVKVIRFQRAAFDLAGVSYPDVNWRPEDFINVFNQFSDDINIISPDDLQHLLISFALENDQIDKAFEELGNLINSTEEIKSNSLQIEAPIIELFNISDALRQDNPEYGWTPISNGISSGLGFAISGATDKPQIAYEFAKYMMAIDTFAIFYGGLAITEIISEDTTGLTLEGQNLLTLSLENMMSLPQTMLIPYLSAGYTQLQTGSTADEVTLSIQNILELQQIIAEQQRSNFSGLATSEPSISVQQSFVFEINAHYTINLDSNISIWDSVLREFIETHPTVNDVILIEPSGSRAEITPDCIYTDLYSVPFVASIGLDLTPLVNIDPDFQEADFLPNVLTWVHNQDGMIAYPLSIVPTVLWINPLKFQEVGLSIPDMDWSILDFNTALETFATTQDLPVLYLSDFLEFTDLLMLVASESQPLFQHANPTAISNLSDFTVYETLQRYIQLYKDDIIRIQQPNNSNHLYLGDTTIPMYSSYLGTYYINAARDTNYQPVAFPRSNTLAPLNARLGVGYIPLQSNYPEACYDWLNTLSKHPELFLGMPVRYSQLSNPAIATVQGEQLAFFYQAYVESLENTQVELVYWPLYTAQVQLSIWNTIYSNGEYNLLQELQEFDRKYNEYNRCLQEQSIDLDVFDNTRQNCAQQNGLQ